MYGKLLIEFDIVVKTGLHIGSSGAFSGIGAADSTVVRDAKTGYPIIPGSSLKGKLRTLLARSYTKDITKMPEHNDDSKDVCFLFGSSSPIHAASLQFADCFVKNADEMDRVGLTEVKAENTINRLTSQAMPRFIERVNPGTVFAGRIVYDLTNLMRVESDLQLLAKAMKLLQLDYLGGHGTRGNGRISLRNFELRVYEADLDVSKLTGFFREVDNYELLPD